MLAVYSLFFGFCIFIQMTDPSDIMSSELSIKISNINNVGNFAKQIVAAVLIPDDDGFISINNDRSIRVWLKRESGRYWPSICEYLIALPTTLFYNKNNRNLFVGLVEGNVMGFNLSADLNSLSATYKYSGHIGSITSISSDYNDQIFTTSKDKRFCWNCTSNGYLKGSIQFKSITTCACIDKNSQCVFIGEESGKIQFVNLNTYQANEPLRSTELCRHTNSIIQLIWIASKNQLVSCSNDCKIIVWEIGLKNGIAYELFGQNDSMPVGIGVDKNSLGILSCYVNGNVIFWDMSVKRMQTKEWQQSDKCQLCKIHFFWDWKEMWHRKKIGQRQHHCRRCGQAVCNQCSDFRTVLPLYGFEVPVRICSSCHAHVKDSDKSSLACFASIDALIFSMDFDAETGRLLIITKSQTIQEIIEQSSNDRSSTTATDLNKMKSMNYERLTPGVAF